MPGKRAPIVPLTFTDQLAAFVTRATAEGWDKKNGIDVATLTTDLTDHRKEKEKDQELLQEHQKFHSKFLTDQAARYQRYMTAVKVVREAYRSQPEIIKSLSVFKRQRGTPRPKAPAPMPPDA